MHLRCRLCVGELFSKGVQFALESDGGLVSIRVDNVKQEAKGGGRKRNVLAAEDLDVVASSIPCTRSEDETNEGHAPPWAVVQNKDRR